MNKLVKSDHPYLYAIAFEIVFFFVGLWMCLTWPITLVMYILSFIIPTGSTIREDLLTSLMHPFNTYTKY